MAPTLSELGLTGDEKKAYEFLFKKADVEDLGVITGEKAVGFFEAAQLPGQTLGEIWAIADDDNTGFLTKEAFIVACRLIGAAQQGRPPSAASSKKSGPLPSFKGITIPGLSTPSPASRVASPPPRVQSPLRQSTIAPAQPAASQGLQITAEDRLKYSRLFNNAGPSNGLLEADKATGILMKSNLPNEQLGQIWNLADTQSRGALDQTDFIIAMALIQGTMSGALRQLPDTLPVSVYAQASQGSQPPGSPLRAQSTGLNNKYQQPLYPQQTGSSLNRSVLGAGLPPSSSQRSLSAFGAPAAAPSSSNGGVPWLISDMEKSQSDQFFNMLDTANTGYIAGDVAVPFFVQSGLSENILAGIWDLSDIRKEGKLSKEEFAVARRLIMDCLGGKSVPEQLEEGMIPPALRGQNGQSQAPQSDVQRDLFSLMDDDEPAPQPAPAPRIASPAPVQQPMATGASSRFPAPLVPSHTGGSARSSTVRSPAPPVPAARGAALSPQPTGASAQKANNFFDSTPTEEKSDALANASAELGNLQNQVASTQRGVSQLRQQRTGIQESVTKIEDEIDDLKTSLAQAKAAYDLESTKMTNLEDRQKKGADELKSLKEQTIRAESDLSALREQKREVEELIMKDKEEAREFKVRLKGANDENAYLKEELERIRKEQRQQKGATVVGKKQLATAEGETERLRAELQAAKAAPTIQTDFVEDPAVTQEHARGIPLPASHVASPALSTASAKSMNPFARMGAFSPPVQPGGGSPQATDNALPRSASPMQQAATMPIEEQASTASGQAQPDPFGMSDFAAAIPASQPALQAPATRPAAKSGDAFPGFDDDFGNEFAPTSSATQPAAAGSTDFDSAFADFDAPAAPAAPAAAAPVPIASPAPSSTRAPPPPIPERKEKERSLPPAPAAELGSALSPEVEQQHLGSNLASTFPEEHGSRALPPPPPPNAARSASYDSDSDDDAGDGDLPPIADKSIEESDSDSDTGDEAVPGHAAGIAAAHASSPFTTEEKGKGREGVLEEPENPSYTAAPEHVQSQPATAEATPGLDALPGAFPTGSPAQSSVGYPDTFEDARDARSVSPAAQPVALPTVAESASEPAPTETAERAPTSHTGSSPTSAVLVEKPAENALPEVPASSGFDDAFGTAAPEETAARSATPPPLPERRQAVPASVEQAPKDDFDDFEDLAPSKVEQPAAVPASTSKPPADFDSNFDDDFGFDNQTFNHANTSAGAGKPATAAAGGFDDAFDDAFGVPTRSVHEGGQREPSVSGLPPLQSSSGFEDDFFSSPNSAFQPTGDSGKNQPSANTMNDVQMHVKGAPEEIVSPGLPDQSYSAPAPAQQPVQAPTHEEPSYAAVPPPGEPPVTAYPQPAGPPPVPAQRGSAPTSPRQNASPAGPRRSTQSSLSPPAPPAVQRTASDDDLPAVKQLRAMGFNREESIAALEDNQFDPERAANALLAVNQ